MAFKFTDAVIDTALVTLTDENGRSVSVSFRDNALVFYRRGPNQGRKVQITYTELLTIIDERHPDFFNAPQPRKTLSKGLA